MTESSGLNQDSPADGNQDITRDPVADPALGAGDETGSFTAHVVGGPSDSLPFTFAYRGLSSASFLPHWTKTTSSSTSGAVTTTTYSYQEPKLASDPSTGLRVDFHRRTYLDFPAATFWWITFTGAATHATQPVGSVNAANFTVTDSSGQPFKIHYNVGALEDSTQKLTISDFEPRLHVLNVGDSMHKVPGSGNGSSVNFPFYNLEKPSGGGMVVGIGWSGQWASTWNSPVAGQAHFTAGQDGFTVQLRPGEAVRTPSIVTLAYTGDRWSGQNQWRRFVTTHLSPRRNGAPLGPIATTQVENGGNLSGITQSMVSTALAAIHASGIGIPVFWIDAGWYHTDPGGNFPGWLDVGDWEPDPTRYPSTSTGNGMKMLSDKAKAQGMQLMLWFEEERTTTASSNERTVLQQPDYLINIGNSNAIMVNLGNPGARSWLTGYINGRIAEDGISIYRHDMNVVPIGYWGAHDSVESKQLGSIYRNGAEQAKFISGFYSHWDGLLAKNNPSGSTSFVIDNCASGGRRIEPETLARSGIFWRSDTAFKTPDEQIQELGLSAWVPFQGGRSVIGPGIFSFAPTVGTNNVRYNMRSAYGLTSLFLAPWGQYASAPTHWYWGALRSEYSNWQKVAHLFAGDYYPLTNFEINDRKPAINVDTAAIDQAFHDSVGRPPLSSERTVAAWNMTAHGGSYSSILSSHDSTVRQMAGRLKAGTPQPGDSYAINALINDAYKEGFGRAPSAIEVGNWTGNLAAGSNYHSIIAAIEGSLAGSAGSRTTAISQAYLNVTGSAPSAANLSAWDTKLQTGNYDYESIVDSLVEAEQLAPAQLLQIVNAYYNGYGRAPRPSEIGAWAFKVKAGTATAASILSAIRSNTQAVANRVLQNKATSGDKDLINQMIRQAYHEEFGRAPSGTSLTNGELGIWTHNIASGSVYSSITAAIRGAIAGSASDQSRIINLAYENGFGTAPNSAALSAWQGRMQKGLAGYAEVMDAIFFSLVKNESAPERASLGTNAWVAWQFQSGNEGVVQAFQRSQAYCPYTGKQVFQLHGLSESTTYTVTDLDAPSLPSSQTGLNLTMRGLEVGCVPGSTTFQNQGHAALFHLQ